MSEADKIPEESGVERLLRDRAQLDDILRSRFTRELTIFFCDIKGFTPFTESRGDIAARAMVQRLNDIVFPALKEFNGTLVKTIGDAVMAYFEDPVQAVKFSIAVQARLHQSNKGRPQADQIHLRIGMNLGEVILDNGDVFGDAVNVAARIEPQAHADDILISASLYEAVRHDREILCRFAKKVKIKGKALEHDLYQVVWDKDLAKSYDTETVAIQTNKTRPWMATLPAWARFVVWGALGLMLLGSVSLWNIQSQPRETDPYINGYSALKARDFTRAAIDFRQLPAEDPRQVEATAALSLWQRQYPRAQELVKAAMEKARQRIYVHVMQGDLLLQKGATREADKEYTQALTLQEGLDWHRAMAYNGMGRVSASKQDLQGALRNFGEAAQLSPDDVDILTNYGLALERSGKTKEAQDYFQKAAKFSPDDELAKHLLQKAREQVKLEADQARRERIDKLVPELLAQYRIQITTRREPRAENEESGKPAPPHTLWLVGLEEKGDLPFRDGENEVFTDLLANELQRTGKIQLIDRQILDRLLDELQLGSSSLANQDAALRIGRLMAARLLLSGRIHRQANQTLINLKVIETETSKIIASFSVELRAGETLFQAAERMADEIVGQLDRWV